MAITEKLVPIIEYVDVERKNIDYVTKRIYRCKKDPLTTIKWCRRNFGDRGDGWDFSGAGTTLDIIIWSHKLMAMYELWHE